MYKLTRISLINWYLVSAQDIEVRDATALVGPTGAGKTSIQDAVQTVMCGGNQRYIRPNASTDSKKSDRKIADYCLGYMDPKADGGVPTRGSCETILALTFSEERSDGTRHDVAVGIAYEARAESGDAKMLNRFIAPGHAFSVEDWIGKDEQGEFIEDWETIENSLKRRCPEVRYYRSNSAEKFVSDMLAEMRKQGRQPDPRHFLQAFSNAIAFKPIHDPTQFVRNLILTPDPLEIERVRDSIARWKEMNETVERIERRLKQITATQGRYQAWANLLVDRSYMEWKKAWAETSLQKLRLKLASGEYRRLQDELSELENLIGARSKRREEDARYLEDLQNQLREKGIQAKLDSAEKDRKHALERLGVLEQECRNLRQLFQMAENAKVLGEWLPPEGERSIALASSALALIDKAGGARWLRHNKPEIESHLEEVQSFFSSLPERMEKGLDEKRSELYELRTQRDALTKNLERANQGMIPLSHGPSLLIELLAQEGIEAIPLCEVVEVQDTRWQFALEALLGRAREALIVDPADLHRALNILYRNRHKRGMAASMLVKTTQTSQAGLPMIRPDSIAAVVSSNNHHALAFIEARVGNFKRVETEEELERSRRAIMPDGKTTSGMSYSVQTDISLIIGQSARLESLRALQEQKSDLEARIAASDRIVKQLANLERLAHRLAEASFDVADMENRFLSAEREIAEAERRREAALAEEDSELVAEVELLKNSIAEIAEEIRELEQEKTKLVMKVGAAGERTTTIREAGLAARKKKIEALKLRRHPDLVECVEWLGRDAQRRAFATEFPYRGVWLEATHAKRDDEEMERFFFQEMKDLDEELKAVASRLTPSATSATNSFNEYLREHGLERPFTTGDNLTSREFGWVMRERQRLESNELRQYQEEAREAERVMRSTLTEDLLVNLHGKFQRLDHQLRSLNMKLKRHRLNNRFHRLMKKPDPAYEDLRKLANKVGENPDVAEAIIEGRTEDPWLEEALRKLNELLEDTGGEGLEDYRNYYTFDLYMDPEAGGDDEIEISDSEIREKKLITLSGRASVGSGGEGQTPFYIAIAASMALAYYPGGNRTAEASGMGLVLFDEAFNRLDIQTTQTLIRFFEELGLQLVIAAPEVHRATFSEVMETIVSINKDEIGRKVYIDSEFPKEHARKELAKINPDWLGVAGYRKRLEKVHAAE